MLNPNSHLQKCLYLFTYGVNQELNVSSMYHCEHICRLAFLQETMSQITSVINYMFTSMYHCEHICRLAFFLDAWIRLEKSISNIPLGLQLISRLEILDRSIL